jgi:probable DNA metabolism protein
MRFVRAEHFDDWRATARRLLAEQVAPEEVHWSTVDQQASLFANEPASVTPHAAPVHVPHEFVALAKYAAHHRDPQRWELLYRLLWRLTHGERQLLENAVDADVHALRQMQKAVKRDEHKMHAFVRFRRVVENGEERYIAWHRPAQLIVRLAAPFFARRFSQMRWSILTPDESVHWDGDELQFTAGVPASAAPQHDDLEELWRTYYTHIFNPARVNPAQMKKEMPVRHWPTLPEAQLIPELLKQAAARVETMIDTREGLAISAANFIPPQFDLPTLAVAAANCTACDLACHATQTVFGRGPSNARIVIVGEQPGDAEDLAGQPFVGPAGQLLDAALAEVQLPRAEVYLTNVVKHFKFVERGKRRLHQKPGSREIAACRPWLEAELQTLRPQVVVCLGSTAAQAIFGRDFRLSTRRGRILETPYPAAILRMQDTARQREMRAQFVHDLTLARAS